MTFSRAAHTALTGLRTNKTRAFLTVLGIVIGITAIILVISLGQGAKKLILSQVQGLGSNTVVVIPGRQPKGPSDFANIFLDSLKDRDLESLANKSNMPDAEDVMPIVFGPVRLAYENETYQATVLGGGSTEVNNVIGHIFDIYPEIGAHFSADDVRSRASVAVIGSKVREKLFGTANPLGEKIKINNRSFRVTGVLASRGQVSFFNFDEMVLTPYTTAQQYILGKKHFDRIILSARGADKVKAVVSDATALIRRNHSITDPDKDDFFVQTQADLAARLDTITSVLTAFLTAIASIALFVGGVGIMNIMLVSVTERTREIGLRKAIGATPRDILTQFLLEAVFLTGAGGVVGIALGTFLSFLIATVLSHTVALTWTFVFPYGGAALGILVSSAVGLVFGIYPAWHAAKMNPVDALRYE